MPNFVYIVKDKEGKILKNTLEAESKDKLIEYLHKEDFIILSIEEAKKKIRTVKKIGKIKVDDLVIFSRQFATLIESGIPIVEALSILREQVPNLYFKEIINIVIKDIKEGSELSKALARQSSIFPEIYVNMIEAAEVSGNLVEILERLSIYLEKSSALRKKVISSMYYPIAVIAMTLGITSFLIFKVVPTFKSVFESLGGELPLITKFLLDISDFLSRKETLILFFIILGSLSFLFFRYIKTDKGKLNFHKFLLKLPVFGELIRKIAIARFARTFSTLVKSGVPIVKSLEIVGKTSGNKVIEEAVLKSKEEIYSLKQEAEKEIKERRLELQKLEERL
ncbi:MAG: type II secretion system F family protein, partial [Candidatus Aenigmatarchaeota archaeon]